jgi:hypothetical protein
MVATGSDARAKTSARSASFPRPHTFTRVTRVPCVVLNRGALPRGCTHGQVCHTLPAAVYAFHTHISTHRGAWPAVSRPAAGVARCRRPGCERGGERPRDGRARAMQPAPHGMQHNTCLLVLSRHSGPADAACRWPRVPTQTSPYGTRVDQGVDRATSAATLAPYHAVLAALPTLLPRVLARGACARALPTAAVACGLPGATTWQCGSRPAA